MKIVSWNVNGIRARINDGTLAKVMSLNADIYCFQELKLSDLEIFDLDMFAGYHVAAKLAIKKGYSGVCIISKLSPQNIILNSGFCRADDEGRYIRIRVLDNLEIISLYMPHGKRDKSDVPYKMAFAEYLQSNIVGKCDIIICTDFNIAHKEIDLARPSQNVKNVMFSAKERKVIDDLLSLGYVDAFRTQNVDGGFYTWWPFSFDAFERNLGWRIDYFFIPEKMKKRIKNVEILKNIRGSDHVPIIMELM